ncbi:response regulator [Vibrio taketomensis]|uniref:response regulator n=1 Tax=Vibrio taketomensis TaxID=2572923 RepID=UPI001389852F|nr:response regulator [Vibrio taketomensis]
MRNINTKYMASLRVLIVDDSSTALYLIKQQLVSLGVHHDNIVTVERYQNAIQAIETHTFDVLILDYHLEQNLTGYELAMLLHRNRLISNTTGVLMISGDARQETVLTALSGKVRHFITKPLSNSSLAEKLHLMHRETQKLTQITEALQSGKALSAATMFELINRSGFSISLEAYLLEYLMAHKQWDFIDAYITISSTPCHALKMCAIACLLHKSNATKQAIDELHDFLADNPLSIRVIDTLVDIYTESGDIEKAAFWATKAFELTPSIGERAAKASELNMLANKRTQLLKVGISYAQHMSLADVNWLKTVITHFHSLQSIYTMTESTAAKTELMHHANKFVRFASRKLTPKRLQQLQAMLLLAHCYVLIYENNEMLAHQKLLQSLSHFYDELYDCPVVLLSEYLPSLALFGEHQIYASIKKVIDSRVKNKVNATMPVQNEGTYNQSAFMPASIENERPTGDYREQYPHSVEAKLWYLYNKHPSQVINDESASRVIAELSVLKLPPNWHNWLITGIKHGFAIEPPAAFSITARN